MDRVWHNVLIEILSPEGDPAKFDSIRVETRRRDEHQNQIISPLAEQNYYPESGGIYSLLYSLKNPGAAIWLAVVDEHGETAKLIKAGVHRYKFRIERQSGVGPENRRYRGNPPRGPLTGNIRYAYYIGSVENFFGNVRSMDVAKYKISGDHNTLTGEKAKITASQNTNSQISLGAEVEGAFKKASDAAKKSKSVGAHKAIQDLKREAKCGFRFNPAGCSDEKPAGVPI
jgi:hypothetical protein